MSTSDLPCCGRPLPTGDILSRAQRKGLNCTKCKVTFSAAQMRKLSVAAGLPLASPIIPEKRRKNAALPGTVFDTEGAQGAEAPTEEEIKKVFDWFTARLDKGIDCPCCTRHAQRQRRPLGRGPARWLLALVKLSNGHEFVRTGELIKLLKGTKIMGSDATSVLPLYGMIEGADEVPGGASLCAGSKGRTSGYWRPTPLGIAFARGEVKVPSKIVTALGIPEAFEGKLVGIRDVLPKEFDYDAWRGKPVESALAG